MKIMKTYILTLFALAILLPVTSSANDGKFVEAMKKNIDAVYHAETTAQLQESANAFERIGNAEKTKWEPYYYQAFAFVMMATKEQDANQKDADLDEAFKAIEKCKAIVTDESEVTAMEGFIYMIRVTVDPASRGPQFATLSMQFFKKALEQNPDNPRAMAMLAQMQYGTAQFFGSSTTEACGTVKAALEKFTTYKSENPIAPVWGRVMAESLMPACQ
jgi:hypothetical protein